MATNTEILTHSHAVLKAKARAKKNQVESVVFDDTARREYLTGFHKRNLAKKEAAKHKAKERERKERLETRKEQRRTLQARAEENAREIESAFQRNAADEIENGADLGSSSREKGKGKATAEYEDEEQLATVTIIDELDPDTLHDVRTTFSDPDDESASGSDAPRKGKPLGQRLKGQSEQSNQRDLNQGASVRSAKKSRERQKKITYETKAARKVNSSKQRTRMKEKTAMAMEKHHRKAKKKRK